VSFSVVFRRKFLEGGRPRLLDPDDEDFVVATATIRPAERGQPFTR
jgi:hypothetical protein